MTGELSTHDVRSSLVLLQHNGIVVQKTCGFRSGRTRCIGIGLRTTECHSLVKVLVNMRHHGAIRVPETHHHAHPES
jgi:hypothetical protein